MSLNPSSPRQAARLRRIAARTGPVAEWMRWRFKMEVDASMGSWLTECHPILGKGIFRYGRGALYIYERGITYGDAGTAIIFDDICDCETLTLWQISQAKRNPWANVEVRLKTGAGDITLALPLFHYMSLMDLFQEGARRRRLLASPKPTLETENSECSPADVQ